MPVTNESIIAKAVIQLAKTKKDGIATFKSIYKNLPNFLTLTSDDLAPSKTRNGEPMWHQIVRNIRSHHKTEGNAIYEGWLEHIPRVGYRITQKAISKF